MFSKFARTLAKHITYANVMSTLAVFMLLGGTAYAAGKISGSRLKDRSVSGKKLRNNSVYGAKLRAGSITGSKLAPNTLTDREVNMGRLGKIGRASSADNAGKVDNKDAAQLIDKCPTGTTDLGSACAETGPRPANTGYEAARICSSAGGYLASAAALVGAERAGKISFPAAEWSGDWTSGPAATTVDGSGVAGAGNPASANNPYRCFYALRER